MTKAVKELSQCGQEKHPANLDTGLTVAQALAVHAGWDAAEKGLPHTMSNGRHWSEGWLNRHWLAGGDNRSWLRH